MVRPTSSGGKAFAAPGGVWYSLGSVHEHPHTPNAPTQTSDMPQLRIVVLVKQVPDTANVTGDAMKEDGTVNRAALPAVFNPEDLNALEEALRLRDRHGARVTVVTMGPPAAVQVPPCVAMLLSICTSRPERPRAFVANVMLTGATYPGSAGDAGSGSTGS